MRTPLLGMEEKKSEIKVAGLFLNPPRPGESMVPVQKMFLEAGKGIVGNTRYYDKTTRKGAKLKRHVSIIAREQIAEHQKKLDMPHDIKPGQVRANIETVGGDLSVFFGKRVRIGGVAIVDCYEYRQPCAKMDKVYPGLWQSMKGNQQGLLAEIIVSGPVEGDVFTIVSDIPKS